MLSRSANLRLTVWVTLALTASSAVSAILCYLYFVGLDNLAPTSVLFAYRKQLSLVLIMMFILHLAGIVFLFRRQAQHCLQPLRTLTQKCSEINIHNLDVRLAATGECIEASHFVTECNAMLERLETGAQRIRQFSGDASHELRTPLTILRGETEVALRWAKTSEEFRTAMQSNMEEIDRMGRIIEDLLTLAKSESGELPLIIKKLSLSDLLQELFLQARSLAEAKNIEVKFTHATDNEIIINGDDLRLRQLFLNLISNAIHYTDDDGQVEIEVEQQNNNAVVNIIDTGIGISTEHLPHIFERFYRTDKDRNRNSGGSGLGLAIVKWVVETHTGTIDVSSTPGIGSKFTVKLPLDGPPPAPMVVNPIL